MFKNKKQPLEVLAAEGSIKSILKNIHVLSASPETAEEEQTYEELKRHIAKAELVIAQIKGWYRV